MGDAAGSLQKRRPLGSLRKEAKSAKDTETAYIVRSIRWYHLGSTILVPFVSSEGQKNGEGFLLLRFGIYRFYGGFSYLKYRFRRP